MNTQQTGVQTAQPSFSHTIDEGWFGNGIGEAGLYGDGKDGLSGEKNGRAESVPRIFGNRAETDAYGIRANRDTLEIRTAPELAESKAAPELADNQPIPEEKRRRSFGRMLNKMKNGIQAFLREMEQRAGEKNSRKFSKKSGGGTRAVTKEEFDRIKTDKSYLLDSYNKYGERSTLGE